MRGNNQDRPKDKTRGNKVIIHDIRKSEKPIGQQNEEMLSNPGLITPPVRTTETVLPV